MRSRAPVLILAILSLLSMPSSSNAGIPFVRGDMDGDDVVDIGDAIALLNYLIGMGPAECLDAADADDDGAVTIVDPLYELYFLFQATAPPPLPFPSCGPDPTGDSLDCASYDCP